jgi:exonuclease III
LDTKDGKFAVANIHKDQFVSYWSDSDPAKLKGSGVALIVNNKWASHYCSHQVYSPYLMAVEFAFRKNRRIWIWIFYAAPSNRNTDLSTAHAFKIILKEFNKSSKDTFHAILGDFNEVFDPSIDKYPPQDSSHHRTNLTALSDKNFIDTYRAIHPTLNETTHQATSGVSARRIDQIWISSHKDIHVTSCIEPADIITDSDHSIYITSLNTSCFIHNNRAYSEYDKAQNTLIRRTIDHSKTTPQIWSEFRDQLNNNISEAHLQDDIEVLKTRITDPDSNTQAAIDFVWNKTISVIMSAAHTALPFSKPKKVIPFKRYNKKAIPERHTSKLILLWCDFRNNNHVCHLMLK